MSDLEFRPVTPDTWPDFERLFEAPGAPKFCWCMAWRGRGAERGPKGPARKQLMRERIERATPVGVLGYAGANGATAVEAYPVPSDAPSYRFMGFVEAFERAGFTAIGRAGKRRHVMRVSASG